MNVLQRINKWVCKLTVCVCACACMQVADEYLAPDVLSTMKEMKVANFRRVPKMPIYGMAQPTAKVKFPSNTENYNR